MSSAGKSFPSSVPTTELHVMVGRHSVGLLSRGQLAEDAFYFSYRPELEDPAYAVSLTMPLVRDPYDAMVSVHPVFEMNLPEGLLRKRLELMFAKVIPGFDDLDLLRIVGPHQLGRIRFHDAFGIDHPMPAQSLSDLLTYDGVDDLLDDLLVRYARYSGLSGMQPKVLFADAGENTRHAGGRTTQRHATHIIKAFDPTEYPELAANEFVCMRIAERAGIPVARTSLSNNRRLLAVDRFDLGSAGAYLGFEDFCVLGAMRSSGRYSGSYEALAAQICRYVSSDQLRAALSQLFTMMVVNCAVGNGDAHLKNFGVLYESYGEQVRMAPAYDIVSTRVYQPRDVLALTLNGTKQFPTGGSLLKFGQQHCLLTPAACRLSLESVADAVSDALAELKDMGRQWPGFKHAAKRLSATFDAGLQQICQG